MSANIDLKIEKGADFSVSINIKQGGNNRNLTGYEAQGSIRKTFDSDTAYDFSFSDLDNSGNIVMTMPYTQTAGLDSDSYVYDVEIFQPLTAVMGYYDNDADEVVIYSVAELAALARMIFFANIPADRIGFLDVNGSGSITTQDILFVATYVGTLGSDALDEFFSLYPNYTDSALENKLSTGNVSVLDGSYGGNNFEKVLKGTVTVTPEVTR